MFQEYYISILTEKYLQFSGRANRKEFWMYVLFNAVIIILLYLIDLALLKGRFLLLTSIYGLATFLPETALAVRRLHDINKSGYHLLWGLVPVFGAIYLIILYCLDSQSGSNTYGEPSTKTSFVHNSPGSNTSSTTQPASGTTSTQINTRNNVNTSDIRKKWGTSNQSSHQPSTSTRPSNNSVEDIRKKW